MSGDHSTRWQTAEAARGSSPLARGTQKTRAPASSQIRLIPARAGNTIARVPVGSIFTAHPRSRGEHISEDLSYYPLAGSSPLARGTLRLGGCDGT